MSHILQPSNVAFALIFASAKPQRKPCLDFQTGVNDVIILYCARRDVTFSRQSDPNKLGVYLSVVPMIFFILRSTAYTNKGPLGNKALIWSVPDCT